jgi:hypothetical protein
LQYLKCDYGVTTRCELHTLVSVYILSAAIKVSHCIVTQVQVNISQISQFTTITNIQVIINQCDSIYTGRRWVKIKVISICKKLNKVDLCNK